MLEQCNAVHCRGLLHVASLSLPSVSNDLPTEMRPRKLCSHSHSCGRVNIILRVQT